MNPENQKYYHKYHLILARYNELGLKSDQVRRRMERRLIKHVMGMGKKYDLPISKGEIKFGRLMFHVENTYIPKAIHLFRHLIGIYSFSPAFSIEKKYENVKKHAVLFSSTYLQEGDTFAVRSRRLKPYPKTTPEIEREVGAAIIKRSTELGKEISVDLTEPDKTIYIEIRSKKAYIYSEKIESYWGGNPIEYDKAMFGVFSEYFSHQESALASHLMLRRGTVILPIFFESRTFPYRKENMPDCMHLMDYYPQDLPTLKVNINPLRELISQETRRKGKKEQAQADHMYVKKKQILYEIHAIPYILEKLKEKVQGKPIQYNGHTLNIKGAITPIRNLDDLERYYIQAGNQHNIVQFTPLIAFNDEQVQTLQSIFEKEIKYRDQDEISQYPEELERGTGGFSVGKVLSSEYLDQEVEVTEEQEEIRVEKVKEIDKNWEMMQTEKHNNKNSNNNNNSNNKNNKNKNKNTADQQGSHIQKKSVYLLMENNLKFFEKSDVKECIEEIVDNSLFLFE